jgi:hypothetical protein
MNGRCQRSTGLCACDDPWRGNDCGLLATLPAQPGGLYGYQRDGYWPNGTAKTSSWGGNMLPSQTGWDLWVSEIPAGLANWAHESRCIYATASNRSGPFVRRSVALEAECHNAQVIRERGADSLPGSYLLFNWPAHGHWVARSETAAGPFAPLNTSAVPECNNPSPAYHPNGTLFVLCNNDQLTHLLPDSAPNESGALDRGAWAPLGKMRLNHSTCGDPDRHWEDAHLWFDARGNWHLLYHVS